MQRKFGEDLELTKEVEYSLAGDGASIQHGVFQCLGSSGKVLSKLVA